MQNVIKEMTMMPELIQQSGLRILELQNSISKVKKQMSTICKATACEVAAEMVDGKKAFGNAEAREAETDKRLQKNEVFQKLEDSLCDWDNKKAQEENGLQNARDIFSIIRYKVRLYTADKMENAARDFLGGMQILSGLGDFSTLEKAAEDFLGGAQTAAGSRDFPKPFDGTNRISQSDDLPADCPW
jgi:hypothetical protein